MKEKCKILVLFLLVFTMIIGSTVFAYSDIIEYNKNDSEDLIFLRGDNPDQIIIIENGEKYILENKTNGKNFEVTLIDENENIIFKHSGNFNDIGFAFYKSNGSGTKDDPYRFCTPGSKSTQKSKLSYGEILRMGGAVITAASISASIITLVQQGIGAKIDSYAIKSLVGHVLQVVKEHNTLWLNNHGVILKFDQVCSLEHYIDNAWGDDEWCYGLVSLYRGFSTY